MPLGSLFLTLPPLAPRPNFPAFCQVPGEPHCRTGEPRLARGTELAVEWAGAGSGGIYLVSAPSPLAVSSRLQALEGLMHLPLSGCANVGAEKSLLWLGVGGGAADPWEMSNAWPRLQAWHLNEGRALPSERE